ncbi:sigma-70 family RNA polymerase sigma factor [Streptomyces purpureus]|uniref:sigma-70 family RNA polymerase sigma factor n=1 Tax=Streptomyces purpureus TaxID=1951 RepID=UPI00037753F7|nr:sigma-70 family RNA polymerase sigma factor [Streptomyces purpureus]
MSNQPEAAVVRAAQAGDQEAQDRLVAEYLPLVYNIAGRALNGHPDTDDVVQETMVRMLSGLDGLRSLDSFRSWLVAITMNQVRGHWRDQSGAISTGRGLEDAYDVVDPGADFVDLTITRLGLSGQRREVAEATRWLDETDQALLSLWWLEAAGELTRAEVAAAMELSPQHTAVRVQRMKAQLEAARVVVRALAADPRCVLLGSMVAQWDGEPSALWRKRIARHARGCSVCSGHWSGLIPAEGLLVGLALVPVAALGAGTATDTLTTVASHAPLPGGRAVLRRERYRRRRRTAVVAAAVAALVVGGGTAHLLTAPEDGEKEAAPVAAVPPPASPAHAIQSPPPSPTPSASPSPSKSPTPSASPSPPKTARPSPTPTPSRTTAKPTPKPAPPGEASTSDARKVAELVNAERAKAGCGPVGTNSKLATAAQRHSEDMAARDYFDHTSPDGTDPGDRITAAGYRWSTYGENIARGQRGPAQVMDSWMNSSGHRANILNCSFKEMGVGIHEGSGGPWWTQAFGTAL